VCAAWMLNPRAIVWDTGLAPSRDLRRVFSQPLTWTRLRNNVTPARATAVLRWLVGLPAERMLRTDRGAARLSRGDRIDATIGRLRDSGKRALLLFSAAEPLEEELVDSGRMAELARCPNICIERIAVRDHTLRPAWAQDQAHAALDRALDRELALIEAPTV
jgi:hypothetical protein